MSSTLSLVPLQIPLPPYPYLLLPIISITFLLLSRRIYYILKPTERYNGIPKAPLMASWLPFVGNALGMAGGDDFWVKAVAKYGPAFRILAVGETRTFVTTPALIAHIYKSSKTFDFYYFRKHMQNVIFGMDLETAHSPVMDDKLFDSHRRGMQPGMIGGAIERYVDQLLVELEGLGSGIGDGHGHGGGVEVDMAKEVYELIYTASSKAWFSPSFPSSKTLKPFLEFDKIFPILNLALPNLLRSPATKARDVMLNEIEAWWSTTSQEERGQMAPALLGMLEVSESEDWSGRNWASCFLAELWALEANAPLAGIWTVAEILRRPSLLTKCQNEIQAAIISLPSPSSSRSTLSDLSNLLQQPPSTLSNLLPTLNAALQESLRIYTSTYSLRVVQDDTIIPPSLLGGISGSENGYSLQKGDQVVCVTRHNQVWEGGDWGDDAGVWDYERFVEGDEKRIKGSMNPFGGGVSMCEGRHFASTEILTFIAAFIHLFEPTLVADNLIPDMQRIGLGVMYSKGSMRVKLKRRDR